jgi:hypothetical protein
MDDCHFGYITTKLTKRNIDMIQETKVKLQHTKRQQKKTHIDFKRTTEISQRQVHHNA